MPQGALPLVGTAPLDTVRVTKARTTRQGASGGACPDTMIDPEFTA